MVVIGIDTVGPIVEIRVRRPACRAQRIRAAGEFIGVELSVMVGVRVARITQPVAIDIRRVGIRRQRTIVQSVEHAVAISVCGRVLSQFKRADVRTGAARRVDDRLDVERTSRKNPTLIVQDGVAGGGIDGIHRAVRADQLELPWRCLVLSDADSRECVIDAPEGTIP